MWCCCIPVAPPASSGTRITLLPPLDRKHASNTCALAYTSKATYTTLTFLALADLLAFRRACNASKQIVREHEWQLSESDNDTFPTIVRGEQLAATISAFSSTQGITFLLKHTDDSAVVSRCARLKRSRLFVPSDVEPPSAASLLPLVGRLQSATIPCTAKAHNMAPFSSCASLHLTYVDHSGTLPWSFPPDAFACLLQLEDLTLSGFPPSALSWDHLAPVLAPKGRLATLRLQSCLGLDGAGPCHGVLVTRAPR